LAEAEDLVQEALARASARWPRLRAYDVPEARARRVLATQFNEYAEEV
jgi:RNA polymerase sigma-70 factor (ECF subfamily)